MREEAMVRGWCPDAWRPMAAGDGLLVRVRPKLGRMAAREVLALCEASLIYGNGLIDLTNRAGLQIRGVSEAGWRGLVSTLIEAGVVSADPALEARGPLIVDPAWESGGDSHRIASELLARAGELPSLPAKIGFVVDAGARPLLGAVPGDFRIERNEQGSLMLRLDGRPTGGLVGTGHESAALIKLAHWFIKTGGALSGRALRHDVDLPAWADDGTRPAAPAFCWEPGHHALGAIYGLPFGQVHARDLLALAAQPGASAIRVSPWRMLLVEGVTSAALEGVVAEPGSRLMQVDACVGAPACPQATVETRSVARRLAPILGERRLHVSGCAKGCARPQACAVVLTGRSGQFDIGFNARAGDAPLFAGVDPVELIAHLGG